MVIEGYYCHGVLCRQVTGGYKGHNRTSMVFSVEGSYHLMKEVVFALKGVHHRNVLHGDVKPHNFMVSSLLNLATLQL